MASLNQALKRLGFINGTDYRIDRIYANRRGPTEEDPTHEEPDLVGVETLVWLSEATQPTEREIADAKDEADAAAYRRQREAKYIADLGKEPVPSFQRTAGDVFDVLIAQVYATAVATDSVTADMTALVTKIAAIKARYPKP